MARFALLLLLTCGLLAGCALGVLDLSGAAEVKKHLAEKEYTLLAFVVQNEAGNYLLEEEWQSVQAQVDAAKAVACTTARELCQEMDVTSFPTIRLYRRDGPTTRYRGPRKAASIASFVRRALRPTVQEVDAQRLTNFSASDDFVFIAKIRAEDENLASRFQDLADEYRDRYSFGISTTAKSDGPSRVRCYNNPDGSRHMATDLDRVGSLEKLLEMCTAALIPQLTRRNEMRLLSAGRSLVYYFTNNDTDRERYTDSMKHTAKEYQEYLRFVTVDSGEYPEMARDLGVRSSRGLAVQNLHNGQTFPHAGEISPDKISQFIVAISEGRVQSWDGMPHDEL